MVDICYTRYVLKHCHDGNVTVVFYNYDTISTKTEEQKRRAGNNPSADIIFTVDMDNTTSRSEFLA